LSSVVVVMSVLVACNPDDLADRFDRVIASLRLSSGEGRARIRQPHTQLARIGLGACRPAG
jgi:hypothetical protein